VGQWLTRHLKSICEFYDLKIADRWIWLRSNLFPCRHAFTRQIQVLGLWLPGPAANLCSGWPRSQVITRWLHQVSRSLTDGPQACSAACLYAQKTWAYIQLVFFFFQTARAFSDIPTDAQGRLLDQDNRRTHSVELTSKTCTVSSHQQYYLAPSMIMYRPAQTAFQNPTNIDFKLSIYSARRIHTWFLNTWCVSACYLSLQHFMYSEENDSNYLSIFLHIRTKAQLEDDFRKTLDLCDKKASFIYICLYLSDQSRLPDTPSHSAVWSGLKEELKGLMAEYTLASDTLPLIRAAPFDSHHCWTSDPGHSTSEADTYLISPSNVAPSYPPNHSLPFQLLQPNDVWISLSLIL
jgi:hypothetical protein